MLQGLFFGAMLYYTTSNKRKIRCVYLRDDNNKAVIICKFSDQVIKVNYEDLEWCYD